jgi:hypothetical protein
MLDLPSTIASSTRSQIEFLLIDIDLAFTFLNIASATENPETRERNQRNARTAYDSVARLASRPILSVSNMDLVWERMAHLKRALELFEGKSIMTEHTLREDKIEAAGHLHSRLPWPSPMANYCEHFGGFERLTPVVLQ